MLKISILSFILVIITLLASAQSRELDSLQQELKAAQGEQKVEIFNQLATKIRLSQPELALTYSSEAYKLSQELNFQSGMDQSRIITGRTYQLMSEYDTALSIFTTLENEVLARNDSTLLATVLYEQATIHRFIPNHELAIKQLKQALVIWTSLNNLAGMSRTNNLMGNIYSDLGQYSKALEVYQQALTYDEELNNPVGISDRYNNIARIYLFKNDLAKGEEYFKKSYEISVSLNDISGQQLLLNNIGHALKLQGKYDEALITLRKSYKILKITERVCSDMYPLYNIGSIYQINNNLDSARYYLNASLSSARSCNDHYIICLALIEIGHMHMKLGELSKAVDIYTEALNTAQKTDQTAELRDAAKGLSETYEKLGNTVEALKYYKVFQMTKDSLFNEQNTEKLARLEAEYEFAQQQKEEELQRKVLAVEQQKTLDQAIWMRNTLIIGILILLIVTYLVLRNYKRKIKANQLLNDLYNEIRSQKDAISLQAEELKNANEEITRINENLEQIVQERTKVITAQKEKILEYVFYNSHKVRGPLARILGLVSLFENKAVNREEVVSIMQDINKEAEELDIMVKQMNRTLEDEKKAIKAKSTSKDLSKKD